MNVLLLSPYFPSNYHHFALALRRNGVNVLGLGDIPHENLSFELRSALTEYYRVDDLHDYDQLLRACGYFTHRYGKLERIESHNEYWLTTDAALRSDFNVPGPHVEEIAWVKRKSKMKKIFRKAGIPVARGKVVRKLRAAEKLIAELGYPVVAKPDIGVGAAATHKIHNDEDLRRFFDEKPEVDYILEEFIAGKLFSFDGLTDQEGNIVFCTSHFFRQGIMETVNEGLELYYYSLRDLPAGLYNVGSQTVKAFKLRERFFHIEFFQVEPGKWVALELNMRPPGGLTLDMFNYANDIDIYQEWANVVTFNRFSAHYSRPYHCAYVGRKWTLDHQLSHEDILEHYAAHLLHHETINPTLAPAIGDYGYLLRAVDLDELSKTIDAMVAARD